VLSVGASDQGSDKRLDGTPAQLLIRAGGKED
jgi:hypothetical protein